MFHALQFGEKPPNSSVMPMRDRGVDSRTHIFSERKPSTAASKMNATQDWAKTQHLDPAADGATPTQAPARQREVSSALLLARQKRNELATKPHLATVTAAETSAAAAATAAAALSAKQAAAAREAPFAREPVYFGQSGNTRPARYGAFADSANAAPAASARPAEVSTAERIHDKVLAHAALKLSTAAAVTGVFPAVDAEPSVPVTTGLGQPPAPPIDVMSPDALRTMVERSSGLKPETAAKKPLETATPPQQATVPRISSQPPVLNSQTLQTIGTWRYSMTPQAAPNSVVERQRNGNAGAETPRSLMSAAASSKSTTLPLHVTGPQVDWWVKSQAKYVADRKEETIADAGAKAAPAPVTSQPSILDTTAKSTATPADAVRVFPPNSTPATSVSLPPGATLVVQPDGSLKLTLPTVTTLPTTTPAGKPVVAAAAAVAAPSLVNKSVTASLPPPAPAPQPLSKLRAALPSVGDILKDSAIVQRVGGPPPTSIGRKTLDTIRAEREAVMKARWLLEAPAREEALQRKVDALIKAIRTSVEAKGFSEPTKGAQYLIKVCLQQSSTSQDSMTFEAFQKIVSRGLNIPGASEEELSALFDRLDSDETTVVPFRRFGELIFDIRIGAAPGSTPVTSQFKVKGSEVLRPTVRKLIEDLKCKIAQRHGGTENWLLAFSSAFRALSRLGEDAPIPGASKRTLNDKQLQAALVQLGLPVTLRDASETIKAIDRDGNGVVDEDEFLYAMRGRMSRRRRSLVLSAFQILDNDKSGEVTLDEMSARFDTSQHPRVLSGEATEQQVLHDFIALWNRDSTDSIITWSEFLDYYKTLSAAIENDDYFELMIRNSWHLSGGEGVAQNTTCRRVLVFFKDGTQRVVEIQNDLGVRATDTDKMIRMLEAQGVTDIDRIQLYG